MTVGWLERQESAVTLEETIQPANVVLDIGPGIRPQQYIKPLVHICFEPFDEYIEHLRNNVRQEHDRVHIFQKGTWQDAVRVFPENSVDTIFLLDVIEHVDKEEGLGLIKASEAIARKQIVIFTPLGFLPQSHEDGKDAWGLNGGSWQEHKSGWKPEDFDGSWTIIAVPDFHPADSMGSEFETPFGAFWAVKTFDAKDEDLATDLVWQNIRKSFHAVAGVRDVEALKRINLIIDEIVRFQRPGALGLVRAFARTLTRFKNSRLYTVVFQAVSALSGPRREKS